MANKIKGIYKSFKYITQIFVVKEREMEIGYPTDVKHVAHIGWDGPSGSGPSWMNEFKTAPDFSTSLGNLDERRESNPMTVSSWSTQDFEESSRHQTISNMFKDIPSSELSHAPKKQKRKKIKSTSSPRSSASSARQARAARSKDPFHEREAEAIVQV